MSNNLFNRLNKPRITKYAPTLVGQTIPYRTKENTSITGNYIDQLVKTWAGVSTGLNTIVDLMIYGIEIKSKDIITNSDWSIGSMRLVDIINTPYEQSSVYQKLQALFLVEYNNDLCSITSANLYYLDNDDAQSLIKAGYEAARQELIAIGINTTRKAYERIKGTPGFAFERMESGTSFNFRITGYAMQKLVSVATSNNNQLFMF